MCVCGVEALSTLPAVDGSEKFARRSRRKETNNTEINKEQNQTKENTYSHEMAFWDIIDPFLLLTGWDLHWIGGQLL